MSEAIFNWKENFVNYQRNEFYIYCDTNASYASVHQYLENKIGVPSAVANGNTFDAGACLAISYEARSKGIQRGVSLKKAKSILPSLHIFESCLPLYEFYSEIFDQVLEWIIAPGDYYRGSCDEVIIKYNKDKYPCIGFNKKIIRTLNFIKSKNGYDINIKISNDQKINILKHSEYAQDLYATCYLLRDTIRQIIGLPISIAVAPSISLAKQLINEAKPSFSKNRKYYKTFHDAIAFPQTQEEANKILRKVELKDLCGIHTIAKRLEKSSIYTVADVQDYCDIDRLFRVGKNKFSAKSIWYLSHGLDHILPGYLATIRDRK